MDLITEGSKLAKQGVRKQRPFRRVNQMHRNRDDRRAVRLEAGLVGIQFCSLRGSGEHADPRKLFEMVGFSVSPPVNPFTACSPVQIRDSSRTPAFCEPSPGRLSSAVSAQEGLFTMQTFSRVESSLFFAQ